jgi:peptide/nickel transport system permease protein
MVYLFAVVLRWFPLGGAYKPGLPIGLNAQFLGSVVWYGTLPALTIIITSIGYWLLTMRNMMVTTMSEDYVLVAEAKGLSPRRIMYTYAARNAMLPSLAGFALAVGFIVGGSVVTEIVFNYPGIGYVLFQSVNNQDYPVMQAVFLIITFTVLFANLFADALYVLLDPRTRRSA